MKAIRFFHFRMAFHKLELCIGLNPFFFCSFVLLFRFGVLRYVFCIHTFAFLVYGVIRYVLGIRPLFLFFSFLLSFVDFTISVFSPFVNTLF